MQGFLLMIAAVAFETVGDTCMKLSDGFKRKLPILGIIFGYAVSFYLLSKVLQLLPLGVTYAIWTGAGVAFTAIVGRIMFKEGFNAKKIAGLLLIVAGVTVLQLGVLL